MGKNDSCHYGPPGNANFLAVQYFNTYESQTHKGHAASHGIIWIHNL